MLLLFFVLGHNDVLVETGRYKTNKRFQNVFVVAMRSIVSLRLTDDGDDDDDDSSIFFF